MQHQHTILIQIFPRPSHSDQPARGPLACHTCKPFSHTCCQAVNISSPESSQTNTRESLGLYRAVGTYHGRYLYQRPGRDRYLLYLDTGDWMVTDKVGHDHGYLSHTGGSVCPEETNNNWEISIYHQHTDTFTWARDNKLRVECVKVTTQPVS